MVHIIYLNIFLNLRFLQSCINLVLKEFDKIKDIYSTIVFFGFVFDNLFRD